MLGENHSVHQEFPEKRELIDKLIAEDMHFSKISREYDTLDKEIRVIELHDSPIGDLTFTEMKKRRGRLKDKIYQMLLKYS
ncbi:MAG: YdcH family protein [Gammaproteobacteria bacterium]|nr:MAG: YdcH family protein [Gammaproteobacteria bacterium]